MGSSPVVEPTRTRALPTRALPTCALGMALMLAACGGVPDPATAPVEASVVRVTDLGAVDQGTAYRGRDGGYSGLHDGRSLWVFGDTVRREADAQGNTWLSNSWSTSADHDASDGFGPLQPGTDAAGLPRELFDFTDAEAAYNDDHGGPGCAEPCGARWALWPAAMVRDDANARTLLFYSKVNALPGVLNFQRVGMSIAVWPDGAARPSRPEYGVVAGEPTLLFDASELPFGHAALTHAGYLYAYACTKDGQDKPCRLARAALSDHADKSRWQYWTGGGWGSDAASTAALFLGNDILSVHHNPHLDRFVAVYSEPLGTRIAMRTAPAPEGPWSVPVNLGDALPSFDDLGWVYDGLAHAELDQEGGRFVHVSYTRQTPEGERELRLWRVELDRARGSQTTSGAISDLASASDGSSSRSARNASTRSVAGRCGA